MIMAGASTMLVGTVRSCLSAKRISGPSYIPGDSCKLYYLGTAIRREDSDWNCKRKLVFCAICDADSWQGNGFNSSSIPVYQSETCGGMIRGALVCLNSTVTIIGLVIVSSQFLRGSIR